MYPQRKSYAISVSWRNNGQYTAPSNDQRRTGNPYRLADILLPPQARRLAGARRYGRCVNLGQYSRPAPLPRPDLIKRALLRVDHGGVDAGVAQGCGDVDHTMPMQQCCFGEGVPQPVRRRLQQLGGGVMHAVALQHLRRIRDPALDDLVEPLARRDAAPASTEVKVRKKRSKSVYKLTRCRMS